MPKSSKIKEHRTYNKRIHYKISPHIEREMDHHYDAFIGNEDREAWIKWSLKMKRLHEAFAKAGTKLQKRRQKVLKIRQKSLQKRHFTP